MENFKSKLTEDSNIIHETALIDKSVKLGKNNYIGPFCIIAGDVTIGDNNRFESHVCIGSLPEHKEAFSSDKNLGVIIQNNNTFREFVTVNGGFNDKTKIYNHNIFLRGSHIGHDVILGSNCTISCNVLLGGHSMIGNKVNMGLGAICHQFSLIGEGAMIGMGTVIPKQKRIVPYKTYVGNPSRELKDNKKLIDSLKLDEKYIIDLRKDYNTAFNAKFF